jgi:dihydroneopterin aldolase
MDRIEIIGIKGFGFHGVLQEEKEKGQEFIVDIKIDFDLKEAGITDDLNKTINYASIAERVKDIIEIGSFNLIEALAEEIAGKLKSEFPIEKILVKVHKPSAPISIEFQDLSVTIER